MKNNENMIKIRLTTRRLHLDNVKQGQFNSACKYYKSTTFQILVFLIVIFTSLQKILTESHLLLLQT